MSRVDGAAKSHRGNGVAFRCLKDKELYNYRRVEKAE
jgi:hypothetical protein